VQLPRSNGFQEADYFPFSLFSYLARLNYSYNEKYLISLISEEMAVPSLQRKTVWQLPFSISRMAEYLKKSLCKPVTFIDELKLRASYGSGR
jgi:hypothetical protein